MSLLLDWGVQLILWVKRFSPALDLPFKAISFTGLEPEMALRFIRYVIVGLGFAVGAPWLFVKLRLAKVAEEE